MLFRSRRYGQPIADSGEHNQAVQQVIAIGTASDDVQMQVDLRRRVFGVVSDDRHRLTGYCPLRTAPECPVFSLASNFTASLGSGFSVNARRH